VVLTIARPLIVSAIVLLVLIAPRRINERGFAHEMDAEKAITTIHTAEMQYYSEYGRYAARLAQLGPHGAGLIDEDLAWGEKNGFRFLLRSIPAGYSVTVMPTSSGKHTFYSNQNMTIHVHDGQEPATLSDPVLGGMREIASAP
jgi:type IV pilus assembly protein PilA